MSTSEQDAEPAGGSAALPSLADGKALLARSRILGRVSAFIFLIAVLAVFDALQTLVRHEFNSIELVPGETVMVSGMMPADARTIADLMIEMEGEPGLVFEPLETYKGFWMGGFMWRANLTVPMGTAPGKTYVTLVDIIKPEPGEGSGKDERDRALLYGGQQNPALVYAVNIWPTEDARRAADNSLFRRYTGFPAFGVAALAVLAAVLIGAANLREFSRAEKALALHGVFFIFGVKDLAVAAKQALPGQQVLATTGYKAIVARAGQSFTVGEPVELLDRDWQIRAGGSILEVDRTKAHARFPVEGVRPRYGWLLRRVENKTTA